MYRYRLKEQKSTPNKIILDVPLFIRLLEYAREDAKNDMDLHNMTENAIKLSLDNKILNMGDYNNIIKKLK